MLTQYLLVVLGVQWVSALCSNPIIRREWSQLSAPDKNAYIAAIKALDARTDSVQYNDASQMSYRDFGITHANNAYWVHGNGEFLTFHRAMLFRFEQALSSVGWNGGVVYLDEFAHAQDWETIDLFSSQYFGASRNDQNCVADGQLGQSFLIAQSGGGTTCITRNGHGTFWMSSQITSILSTARSYSDIRGDDTANFHAAGHFAIGGSGTMSSTTYSPGDPGFWFHHAMIDKVWWKFQNLCKDYVHDYEGNLAAGQDWSSDLGQSLPVSPSQPLDSWTSLTAGDVLDTRGGVLCYSYSKSASDEDFVHATCPDGTAPNYNPFNGNERDASPPTPSPSPSPSLSPSIVSPSKSAGDSSSLVTSASVTTTSGAISSASSLASTNTISTTRQTQAVMMDSQWLFMGLRTLILHPVANATFGGKTFGFQKRDDDNTYVMAWGPNGTKIVNVTMNGIANGYVIPAGCELYKTFQSHISVIATNFTYDASKGIPDDYPCPVAIHSDCPEDPVCEPVPGARPPTPNDPCQYPTVLPDWFIDEWNLNKCMIRRSDCRQRQHVDRCNIDARQL